MRLRTAARAGIDALSFGRREGNARAHGVVRHAIPAGICLAATFLNFLNHNDYPVARIETGLSLLILSIAAILFAFLRTRLRRREGFLLSMLFVVIVVQMNFDGGPLLLAGTFAAAFLLGNSVLPFAGIAFFVVFVCQIVLTVAPANVVAPAAARDLAGPPLLVHVLLDGAIGIEGMPDDMPEATKAAAWARGFLAHKGFAVFGRAYSQHLHTVNAVPSLLGFGTEGEVAKDGHEYRVGDNAYMAALRERGYKVTAYRNVVADYCGSPEVDTCWSASGYRATSRTAFSTYEKTWVLMYAFASLSPTFEFTARLYDLAVRHAPVFAKVLSPLDWTNGPLPSPLGGMEALDRLVRRIAKARDGEAYFAHVLLPHGPFAYGAGCTLKPPDEWASRESSSTTRPELYRAYVAQWRCALLRIGELVDALEAARPDGRFIVVVHGDHGSRIVPTEPTTETVASLSPQNFRDCYSTLLAIRMPDLAPGYRREIVSVQHVLQDLVAAEFQGPFHPRVSRHPSVFLTEPMGLTPTERFAVPRLFN